MQNAGFWILEIVVKPTSINYYSYYYYYYYYHYHYHYYYYYYYSCYYYYCCLLLLLLLLQQQNCSRNPWFKKLSPSDKPCDTKMYT